MNGVILSLMLSYSLINWSWPSGAVPVEAEIAAGYHIGPFYGLVSVTTWAVQQDFGWAYNPMSVLYDFRLGVKAGGFDIYLSRFCRHDIDGGNWRYPADAGLKVVVRWSTWEEGGTGR